MTFRTTAAAAAFIAVSSMTAGTATAGPITRACMSSDRGGANRALCGCIQAVADMTLNGQDQRLAAKFFKKPDMAEKVRMSKSDYHNAFWARYRQFGATASAACS